MLVRAGVRYASCNDNYSQQQTFKYLLWQTRKNSLPVTVTMQLPM